MSVMIHITTEFYWYITHLVWRGQDAGFQTLQRGQVGAVVWRGVVSLANGNYVQKCVEFIIMKYQDFCAITLWKMNKYHPPILRGGIWRVNVVPGMSGESYLTKHKHAATHILIMLKWQLQSTFCLECDYYTLSDAKTYQCPPCGNVCIHCFWCVCSPCARSAYHMTSRVPVVFRRVNDDDASSKHFKKTRWQTINVEFYHTMTCFLAANISKTILASGALSGWRFCDETVQYYAMYLRVDRSGAWTSWCSSSFLPVCWRIVPRL